MKKLLLLLLFCSSTAFAAGTATLSWDYLASDVTTFGVTNFNLERKVGACVAAGTFVEVATPAATLRAYADPNLTSGLTYSYRLAASGPGGKSGYSNCAEKFIPFAVPPAPGNVTVVITISLNPDTGKYQPLVQQ